MSAGHTEAPGALFRLLEPLARHKISMTRIESRPSRRRKWDYVFFIDIEGHAEDAAGRRGARRAQEARLAVPRARLLSAGGAVSMPARNAHPGRLAVAAVRDLSPYVPGKPISELERELGISNIIKLASNENPLGPGAAGAGRDARRARRRSSCIRTAAVTS